MANVQGSPLARSLADFGGRSQTARLPAPGPARSPGRRDHGTGSQNAALLSAALQEAMREIEADPSLQPALAQLGPRALGRLVADAVRDRLAKLDPGAQPPRLALVGGLAAWQVRRTTEFLHRHLDRNVPLAELARVARLSEFHFARAFKRSVGETPHAYLIGLRIARAKELLETTGKSVTEIAGEVGYDTPQSLSRIFARQVGMTPSDYRRSHACGDA